MQVCKYASKYAGMQVYKYASVQVCKYDLLEQKLVLLIEVTSRLSHRGHHHLLAAPLGLEHLMHGTRARARQV